LRAPRRVQQRPGGAGCGGIPPPPPPNYSSQGVSMHRFGPFGAASSPPKHAPEADEAEAGRRRELEPGVLLRRPIPGSHLITFLHIHIHIYQQCHKYQETVTNTNPPSRPRERAVPHLHAHPHPVASSSPLPTAATKALGPTVKDVQKTPRPPRPPPAHPGCCRSEPGVCTGAGGDHGPAAPPAVFFSPHPRTTPSFA
jgi:hypothetical protein